MGLKDELVQAMAVPFEEVEVNGTKVRVSGMTAEMQLEMGSKDSADAQALLFWVAERCVQDLDGKRIFKDGDPALRGVDPTVLTELVNTAIRLSGLTEAVKN